MLVPSINRIDIVQRTKKIVKKNKRSNTKFRTLITAETSSQKQVNDVKPIKQTLFFLQELDSNQEDDELLAQTKEYLQLLNQYRLTMLDGEIDLDQLQCLIDNIKEVKKGVLNYNILAILNRIETLAAIEVAKTSLTDN